eukprot:3866615-Prymnesium_polylepis.1
MHGGRRRARDHDSRRDGPLASHAPGTPPFRHTPTLPPWIGRGIFEHSPRASDAAEPKAAATGFAAHRSRTGLGRKV